MQNQGPWTPGGAAPQQTQPQMPQQPPKKKSKLGLIIGCVGCLGLLVIVMCGGGAVYWHDEIATKQFGEVVAETPVQAGGRFTLSFPAEGLESYYLWLEVSGPLVSTQAGPGGFGVAGRIDSEGMSVGPINFHCTSPTGGDFIALGGDPDTCHSGFDAVGSRGLSDDSDERVRPVSTDGTNLHAWLLVSRRLDSYVAQPTTLTVDTGEDSGSWTGRLVVERANKKWF